MMSIKHATNSLAQIVEEEEEIEEVGEVTVASPTALDEGGADLTEQSLSIHVVPFGHALQLSPLAYGITFNSLPLEKYQIQPLVEYFIASDFACKRHHILLTVMYTHIQEGRTLFVDLYAPCRKAGLHSQISQCFPTPSGSYKKIWQFLR